MLQLEGRSGCRLEIMHTHEGYRVKKYASEPDYNPRLKRQLVKQSLFAAIQHKYPGFRTPVVREEGLDAGSHLFWFSMDYVSGRKASEHLALINREELVQLTELLLDYFDTGLKESEWRPSPVATIRSKIEQLQHVLCRQVKIQPKLEKSLFGFLSHAIPEVPFPVGFCHGDLTLSNMLFHRHAVYLIDFLDSFLESPVIDLVKIRQDTRYYWTWLLDQSISVYETNKAKIALNYLDHAIRNYFHQDERLLVWHNYLEIMNLARILPYTSQKKELDFLVLHLEDLLNKTQQ